MIKVAEKLGILLLIFVSIRYFLICMYDLKRLLLF